MRCTSSWGRSWLARPSKLYTLLTRCVVISCPLSASAQLCISLYYSSMECYPQMMNRQLLGAVGANLADCLVSHRVPGPRPSWFRIVALLVPDPDV